MEVHHRHIKKIRLAAKFPEMRHHVAMGNLGALFHHVTELAGKLESTVEGVDL